MRNFIPGRDGIGTNFSGGPRTLRPTQQPHPPFPSPPPRLSLALGYGRLIARAHNSSLKPTMAWICPRSDRPPADRMASQPASCDRLRSASQLQCCLIPFDHSVALARAQSRMGPSLAGWPVGWAASQLSQPPGGAWPSGPLASQAVGRLAWFRLMLFDFVCLVARAWARAKAFEASCKRNYDYKWVSQFMLELLISFSKK